MAAILQRCCQKHAARREELLAEMLLPQRGGPIAIQVREGQSFVAPLGQFFVLKALDGPAEDLCRMPRSFRMVLDPSSKFQDVPTDAAPDLRPWHGQSKSSLFKLHIAISTLYSWTEVQVCSGCFTHHTALYCCKSRCRPFVLFAVDPLPCAASLGRYS